VTVEPPPDAAETNSEPPPDAPPATPPVPELEPVPDDAGDTRGRHLGRLAGSPTTLVVGGGSALAVLLIAGTQAGWAIGAIGAAVTLLVVFLAVWLRASSAARDDFFAAYAEGRHLTRIDGRSRLPPLTPLLQRGDERYAEQRFNGVLPGGLDGSLCLYTYEDSSTDSDGNRQTTYVHFTVVVSALPATATLVQELYCQRRFGFRFMDSAEDAFRRRQRVEHESEAVDRKYEIFIGRNDDLGRARQILSPSFLVWLEGHSPEEYAFELVAGSLVCNVKGHKRSAAELDVLCTASAAVARRLQEEADELPSSPGPGGPVPA
jgi:hypothetical protein